jgi:translation initiation factor IF-2
VVRPSRAVEIPATITVQKLAELLGVSGVEVIKQLMRNGVMASLSQIIDFDAAAIVAADLGVEAKPQPKTEKELALEVLESGKLPVEDPSKLKPRPSVVTILGHVDHGKTTLLDVIRQTKVAATEVGGITQHIGAYQVEVKGQKITFLDTPGHEAFTAMRARGAKATDIVILVVAADDGVMPQTVEAVNHTRAAGVPMVVAINKIDKPGANPERVKQQLSDQGVLVEQYGGDVPAVPISAKQRMGIDDLLDTVLILAEMQQLRADPDRPAAGVVIEAKLDKTKGPVATLLVQTGALQVGDVLLVGHTWGRVKAMLTEMGRRLKKAEPSTPVEVLGLNTVPQAGDTFVAVKDERAAKAYLEQKQGERDRAAESSAKPVTLSDLFSQIKTGQVKELNLVLKTDVQGSIEPVKSSLERLSSEKAKVNLLHTGTGSITESDVLLAIASKAIILGFNSRIEPGARRMAEIEGVEIRLYDIIYKLVEDVQKALEGILEPAQVEVLDGRAEVKQVFPLGKRGAVAGLFIREGKLLRGCQTRVLRGGKVVHQGQIASMRHFQQDVREMPAGSECGVVLEGFSTYQVGDLLECFHVEKAASRTSASPA